MSGYFCVELIFTIITITHQMRKSVSTAVQSFPLIHSPPHDPLCHT